MSPEITTRRPGASKRNPNAGFTGSCSTRNAVTRTPSRSKTSPSSSSVTAHAGRLALVHVRAPNLDVPGPESEEPLHVGGRAGRTEHLEWRVLADDPAGQHEMTEVDHVVGVQMGEQDTLELARPDPGAEELHRIGPAGIRLAGMTFTADPRDHPS